MPPTPTLLSTTANFFEQAMPTQKSGHIRCVRVGEAVPATKSSGG
ncbi:hypothetical protein QE177_15500 (plasmid) [Arsenophonus sp. aPb]|nr:hypothetical protein [Arsenophonus sp. aPb]WGL99920.1 hypothetical protein QE177_15500 [Arsenophonus sp. aPb]